MDTSQNICVTAAPVTIGSLTPDEVTDGLAAIEATYRRPDVAGVAVVDGFGCKITVERGALQLHDGIGQDRRTRRYDRATHGLRRVVLMNPEGFVTFDALRWCQRLGIGVVVLDGDGTATLASTPRLTDDARLRRVQALAPYNSVGLGVAGYLLSAKVAGQARLVFERFSDPEAECFLPGTRETSEERSTTIAELAEAIKSAETIEECRQLEASAAALYWGAWACRPETAPNFVAKDRARVPAAWGTFEGRRSVLASSGANRKAERPVNALINYLSALLEAEAILACQAVGLDPGLGIVHNDARGRQSLALDLIEPIRPEAEGFVLDMLEARTFLKADFTENTDGHVKLRAPLSHELCETLPRWARSLGPVAEKVANMLGHAMEGKYTPVTPLTSAKQRNAQAIVKARKIEAFARTTRDTAKQRPVGPAALPIYTCPDCGGPVTNPRHVLCEPCQASAGHSASVRQSRGRAIAARKQALKERVAAFGLDVDPTIYRERIFPALASIKLAQIMEATGYSKGYCSTIRAGTWTPHVSTWPALAALVGLSGTLGS